MSIPKFPFQPAFGTAKNIFYLAKRSFSDMFKLNIITKFTLGRKNRISFLIKT